MSAYLPYLLGILGMTGFLAVCVLLGRHSDPGEVKHLLGSAMALKGGRGLAERKD